jgi:DNA-binding transcriptional ArsR family regulator
MVVDTLSEHEIDRIFQALSDATRRDIFVRTIDAGCSISSLASQYDMSFAAVQKHVVVLERAALVTKTRRGREQIVSGYAPTLHRVTALLDGFEQMWRQRVQRIAEILDEQGDGT